jgi:hypothetical protein
MKLATLLYLTTGHHCKEQLKQLCVLGGTCRRLLQEKNF